jgi:hypothetical protein
VVDAAGSPTDRRALDERREEERRAGDDRRAADAGERVGIPPALDRALAEAVLDAVGARRGDGAGAAGAGEAGAGEDVAAGEGDGGDRAAASHDGALPPAVAAAVARVADALAAQGAGADAVRDALEDAFAALLAGQRHDAARGRVRALAAGARQLATAPPDTRRGS